MSRGRGSAPCGAGERRGGRAEGRARGGAGARRGRAWRGRAAEAGAGRKGATEGGGGATASESWSGSISVSSFVIRPMYTGSVVTPICAPATISNAPTRERLAYEGPLPNAMDHSLTVLAQSAT